MEEQSKKKTIDLVIFVAVFLLTSSIPFSLFIPDPELVYWLNVTLRLAFFLFAFFFLRKSGLARPAFTKPNKRTILLSPFLFLCLSNFMVAWIQGSPVAGTTSLIPLVKAASFYLLVAVGEELVFRAVVYSEFRKRWPLWKAVVISSLIFALPHLLNATSWASLGTSALQVGYSFFLGLILAIVYEASGNIIWAMALHFLFDFLNGYLASQLFPLPWELTFYVTNVLVYVSLALYFLLIRPALFRKEKQLP